jgi:hypothetical protein
MGTKQGATESFEELSEVLTRVAAKLSAGEELEWRTECAAEFTDQPSASAGSGPAATRVPLRRPARSIEGE